VREVSWWESASAATIYGVVIGGAITGSITVLNNRHAERVSAAERESRAEQAELDREHDRRQLIQTARDRAYSAMALAAQNASASILIEAARAMAGLPVEDIRPSLDTPESRKAWADMAMYATTDTRRAWETYLTARRDLLISIHKVWVAERSGDSSWEPLLELDSLTDEFNGALTALNDAMSKDLTMPEELA
jgi:hypothetical protein